MSALARPQREAFARARAAGASPKEAAIAAGYRNLRRAARMAGDAAIVARVREIEGDPADSGEPAPPVPPASADLLVRVNDVIERTIALKSAAGYAAAFRGFALIASLEGRFRAPPLAAAQRLQPLVADPELHPFDRDFSREEWEALFGPEASGGKAEVA